MSKWVIDKEFGFDYGHRVWSQTLNTEYSLDDACVCRHLHGHRASVHIFLEGTELHQGMITDFKHLNWVKKFLDDNLDHKFIIDRNDPWFEKIINGRLTTVQKAVNVGTCVQLETIPVLDISGIEPPQQEIPTSDYRLDPLPHIPERYLELIPSFVPGIAHVAGYNLAVSSLEGPEQEFYEGFFIVDFLPTSENLSKWVFDCVDAKMKLIDVQTSRVEWFETPKSRSSYSG